jgi:hypothetical protein
MTLLVAVRNPSAHSPPRDAPKSAKERDDEKPREQIEQIAEVVVDAMLKVDGALGPGPSLRVPPSDRTESGWRWSRACIRKRRA